MVLGDPVGGGKSLTISIGASTLMTSTLFAAVTSMIWSALLLFPT